MIGFSASEAQPYFSQPVAGERQSAVSVASTILTDTRRVGRYNGAVPKWLKMVFAILLLPVCLGAVGALARVLRISGQADTFWVAFIGGAACWTVVFLMLPKPMRLYVFGHELTHALWAWLFGGRVKRFKVAARGGHVVITRSNFLIVLAPYFFPLYAVLVVLLFALGHVIFDWSRQVVWFHLLLGAAYGFHVTLTARALQTRQTDLTSQGYLFSAAVIFLGNISVLLLGLPLLTGRVRVLTALAWWLHSTSEVVLRLAGLF